MTWFNLFPLWLSQRVNVREAIATLIDNPTLSILNSEPVLGHSTDSACVSNPDCKLIRSLHVNGREKFGNENWIYLSQKDI